MTLLLSLNVVVVDARSHQAWNEAALAAKALKDVELLEQLRTRAARDMAAMATIDAALEHLTK